MRMKSLPGILLKSAFVCAVSLAAGLATNLAPNQGANKAWAQDSSFVSNMSPIPLAPTLFSVDLVTPNNSGPGIYHSVELISGNVLYTWSSLPSIEAGKQFAIRYKRTSALPPERGNLERVELFFRVDNGPVQSRIVGDGFRDPLSGELVLSPVVLDVPPQARDVFAYWFQLTTFDGRIIWDKSEAVPYTVEIVPASNTILKFDQNWNETANAPLVSGESFRIAFDVNRIKPRLSYLYRNDVPVWSVAAMVSFDNDPAREVPLTAVSHDNHGVASDLSVLMPAVKIPVGAKSVSLWFVGRDYVSKVYDSNYNRNYTFPIEPAIAPAFTPVIAPAPAL